MAGRAVSDGLGMATSVVVRGLCTFSIGMSRGMPYGVLGARIPQLLTLLVPYYSMGTMTLGSALEAVGWTEAKLAEMLRNRGFRIYQPTINNIKRGTGGRRCSLPLALEIEALLDGKVRAEELPLSAQSRLALERIRAREARV